MRQTTIPRRSEAPLATAGHGGPQSTATPGQHSLGQSILLHLYPGLALSAFVVLTASTVEAWGMDPFFAFLLGIGVVLTPLELGYLMVHARRTTGSWSPMGAVDYHTRLPIRRLLLLGSGLAAFMLLFVVAQMAFLDRLISPLFSWIPATLFTFSSIDAGGDPLVGGPLVATILAIFVFNGVAGPIVEELYFRGHLLPRIDRLGRRAPVLNAVLFALYHFHTPWRWPQVLLGGLPISWLAWRKRSVWVSMAAHVIVNMLFSMLLIAGYLADAA